MEFRNFAIKKVEYKYANLNWNSIIVLILIWSGSSCFIMEMTSMAEISVIMSVYKEPLSYIKVAVDSILNQTFSDFEFIIIVDAPDNLEMIAFLQEKAATDARVFVVVNEKNIGVAMSLNKAIDLATGKYLARMDADDKAYPSRFAIERQTMIDRNLDMIASAVDLMDENDNLYGQIMPFSTDLETIRKLLPYQNIIIHPTVMMKTSVVRSCGGYRNFSSSQDYDLWLRFLTKDIKIGLLNEKLLCFRRHINSVSATKGLSQVLNERYIRELFSERKDTGNDSFSEENQRQFFESLGCANGIIPNNENYVFALYRNGMRDIKQKKYVIGMRMCLLAMKSKHVRYDIWTKVLIKIRKRRLKRRKR